ncbi:YdgA family protein [Agarivorans sp. TSD2052]|uniref:YdgA family protein n=1 Tax=Agarivorans sp. TSD2052 TaxID=2937286 RepID=UPI00200CF579|nr:YdgA family protein [Agarivorans sp. TSD2052]UPW18928.1 YdgA family protein [Agarivorans sp. TSD2052]
MKKTAISLLLISLMLVLGQYLTRQQYQHQLDQLLTQLAEQHSGWDVSVQLLKQGWWQRNEQWTIVGDMAELGFEPQAVNLAINHQVTIFPIWLRGQWQLDPVVGDDQPSLTNTKLKQIPHQGLWTANILNRSMVHDISVDTFQQDFESLSLAFKPLKVMIESDLAMQQGSVVLTWQGMKLDDQQQTGDFINIGQVDIEENFTQHHDWSIVDQANWKLQQLSLSLDQGATQLAVHQLRVNNVFSEQQQLAYMRIDTALTDLQFKQNNQQLTMGNLDLRSSVGGVPMDTLIQLAQGHNKQTNLDQLIQQVASNKLTWTLESLSVDIDSDLYSFPLSGDVNIAGTAALLPFKLSEVSSSLQLLRYLDVNLSVDLSDQLFSANSLSAYVLALRQAGYLEHSNGRDKSQLIFNDSEFSMNQQAVN